MGSSVTLPIAKLTITNAQASWGVAYFAVRCVNVAGTYISQLVGGPDFGTYYNVDAVMVSLLPFSSADVTSFNETGKPTASMIGLSWTIGQEAISGTTANGVQATWTSQQGIYALSFLTKQILPNGITPNPNSIPAPASDPSHTKSSPSTIAIVGLAVGVVAFVIAVVLLSLLAYKRRL